VSDSEPRLNPIIGQARGSKPGVEGFCLYSRYIDNGLRVDKVLLYRNFFIAEFD